MRHKSVKYHAAAGERCCVRKSCAIRFTQPDEKEKTKRKVQL
jgi:hypothetical protein